MFGFLPIGFGLSKLSF